MIQIQSVSKSYGDRNLFRDISFSLTSKEKVGLLGRNGTGKTTFIKFLSGDETPDTGAVIVPKGYRIGHLSQHISFTKDQLLEEACLGLPPGEEYSSYLVEEILMGLGFSEEDFLKSPHAFSGGYQLRIQLAKILASRPDALLLDEPTNFLDLPSIRWVEKYFKKWPGEMIIISHDREFLDSVCTSMALLHRGKMYRQQGSTSMIYELVAQSEELYERTRVNVEKKKAHLQNFVDRFGAKASKAVQAQSKTKAINKLPSLTKLAGFSGWDLNFPYAEYRGKKIFSIKEMGFHFKEEQPLFDDFNLTLYNGQKIACIGKNGKGKSTLLRLIAGFVEPLKGEIEISDGIELGFFGQGQSFQLEESAAIEEEIGAANPKLAYSEVRRICGLMMFSGDLAKKKRTVLSGGEKSRVLLGKTIATKGNLLLLDEPTNHLDVESIEALIEAIERYPGSVVLVTHSEHVLRSMNLDRLIVFNDDSVEIFDGGYEDYLQSDLSLFFEDAPAKKSKKKKGSPKKNAITNDLEIKSAKKKVRDIEKVLEKDELRAARLQEELVECMSNSNTSKMETLSKEYDSLKKHIESQYEALESIHNDLDRLI